MAYKERLGRRQAVRHRVLIPACAGSNPAAPAKLIDFGSGADLNEIGQDENRKGSTKLRSGFERRAQRDGPAGAEGRRPEVILPPQPVRRTQAAWFNFSGIRGYYSVVERHADFCGKFKS